MKSVMISIKPKWCELIASGLKTVEVRKTKPKIKPPFKCYIYKTVNGQTNTVDMFENNLGKVIGEFVCDDISINLVGYDPQKDEYAYWTLLNDSCLTKNELMEYGKYHTLYGWHISDLVIYDRPKDIIEFLSNCKYLNDDGSCQYEKIECDCAKTDFNFDNSVNMVKCLNHMTRPPQSWCYVEDKEL